MRQAAVLSAPIPDGAWPCRRGKVRDVFDLGDRLLLVSTDRISAYDWVLPNGIPDKGRVLTQLTLFWLNQLSVENHLLTTNLEEAGLPAGSDLAALQGRSMLVRKAEVVPIECVVRGYLEGSGWREYQEARRVCGIELPPGLLQGSRLESPIFTPATKAQTGHDENISFEQMADIVGGPTADELQRRSVELYLQGAAFASRRGLIIADTKLEWGRVDDRLILIDELMTPDSSRFWPADQYAPGRAQSSFDKQFVRDWLSSTPWDKNSPPPSLPADVIEQTRAKYVEAYQRLTGRSFPW